MSGPWRAVLFDVEGVIARRDERATREQLGRLWPGLTPEALDRTRNSERLYPLWVTFSCGRLSSTSYWAAVLAELGLEVTDDAVEHMRRLQARTAWAVIDEPVLRLVRILRDGSDLRLGILSNSSVDYERDIVRFESQFDVACFSHRTGRRKPDAEAFTGAAEDLGVPSSAIVFLDDKPRNVAAAQQLGMRACLVTGADDVHRHLIAVGLLGGDE